MTLPQKLVLISLARTACQTGEARALRHQVGLTLAEVADAVGVSVDSVHKWEQGTRRPSGVRAERYGRLLRDLRQAAAA